MDLQSNGVVGVSFSSTGIPYLESLLFYYVAAGGSEEWAVQAYPADFSQYWGEYYSEDAREGLAVMELPAGAYEFTRWSATAGGWLGGREISPLEPISVRFSVEPGKVLYLGNLYLQSMNVGKVTVDGAITQHVISVRDRGSADLEAIRSSLPPELHDHMEVRLMIKAN
jgi:hypothetical protein